MMKMKTYKYHPFIDDYIELVESGKVQTCKETKQLIEHVKKKLDSGKVIIEHEKIDEAVVFIEKYFPFNLFAHQKFSIACIVGLFYEDGTLVFNEFLFLMGRGAGKNGFGAAIAKYFIAKQGIRGYNIDMVATSKGQAETSFLDVWNILDDNESKMKKHFHWTKEVIMHKKTKSKFKYYTNNAKTKDGLRPGAVIFDEIHAYEKYDNIKVFTSALGKVPRDRRFYLTTDGYVRGGVLDDFKAEAKLVLEGELPNSRMFPFICKLDNEDEVNDPTKWEKANPSLPYLPDLRVAMQTEYDNMQTRPSARMEFMTKRMNCPQSETMFAVAPWEQILATNQEFPEDLLRGSQCIGAIDFASTDDIASVGLLFKHNGKRYFKNHNFIHVSSLKDKDFKIDLDLAIQEGLLTIVRDPVITPEHLMDWFYVQAKKYKIKFISADMYRLTWVKEIAENNGFEVRQARSGSYTHTQMQPLIELMFATNAIVFGDNRMMRWFTNNVYKKFDTRGNVTYEKIEPYLRKTDGFFALLHGLYFDSELKEHVPITKENVSKIFKSFSY